MDDSAKAIREFVASNPERAYSLVLGGSGQFVKKGGELYALCPLHADTDPSFRFNPNKNGAPWNCFPCNANGDVFDLYGLMRGLKDPRGKDFPEVVTGLANLFGINGSNGRPRTAQPRDFREPPKVEKRGSDPADVKDRGAPTAAQVRALILSRRITRAETLERIGVRLVRWMGAEYLGFPTLAGSWKLWEVDASGRPTLDKKGRLSRRNIGKVSFAVPRELHDRNGSALARLYDVAGESDLLAILDAGCSAAIAASSGESNTRAHENDVDFLVSLQPKEVVLVRDLDKAGREGAEAAADWWRRRGIPVRILPLPQELGEKGDLRDYLLGKPEKNGNAAREPLGTFDDLERLADAAEVLGPVDEPEQAAPPDDARLRALAELSPMDYDRQREQAAEELGIRVSTLDAEVLRLRGAPSAGPDTGRLIALEDPEPWPDRVDGAALLDEIAHACRRFVALPDGSAEAIALWCVYTSAFDAFAVSPLLVFSSPERRCGKTRTLDLLSGIVRRPLAVSNITAAALFRAIDSFLPTLLIDEGETFLGERDELRGIINSGHTRVASTVIRTVGDDHEARMFSVWCPKVLALIGKLHPTLADRSIIVPMRRRAPGEKVESLRLDRLAAFEPLRRRAFRWAQDHVDGLRAADPAVPSALHDRAADNWRPLLAIADLAGGEWPSRARSVARLLTACGVEDDSVAILLLSDIRECFKGSEHISTKNLLDSLHGLEERPWASWGKSGKPMTNRQLATMLRPFGITSGTIRTGPKPEETIKGYELKNCEDAFARYVPSVAVTPSQPAPDAGFSDFPSVTGPLDVTDEKLRKPLREATCDAVTDAEPPSGGNGGNEGIYI